MFIKKINRYRLHWKYLIIKKNYLSDYFKKIFYLNDILKINIRNVTKYINYFFLLEQ